MGRVRGKGKKSTVIAAREEPGSGGEEKIPVYRRRGRPQKPLKDDIQREEETEKTEEDGEEAKNLKYQVAATENGRKRKRSAQAKENMDSVKEENGVEAKSTPDDATKFVGFRQNSSRRKNKPRRAAEAGVECK